MNSRALILFMVFILDMNLKGSDLGSPRWILVRLIFSSTHSRRPGKKLNFVVPRPSVIVGLCSCLAGYGLLMSLARISGYCEQNDELSTAKAKRIVSTRLLFMKRGGKLIYAGPLGPKSCRLVEYFEAIEGVRKIKAGHNSATWMLEFSSQVVEARLELAGRVEPADRVKPVYRAKLPGWAFRFYFFICILLLMLIHFAADVDSSYVDADASSADSVLMRCSENENAT
ncbi:hypothetical protein Tco_0499752 [Tanacetum coccineum]